MLIDYSQVRMPVIVLFASLGIEFVNNVCALFPVIEKKYFLD